MQNVNLALGREVLAGVRATHAEAVASRCFKMAEWYSGQRVMNVQVQAQQSGINVPPVQEREEYLIRAQSILKYLPA